MASRRSAPAAGRSPARSAPAKRSTRAFSVITWRALERGKIGGREIAERARARRDARRTSLRERRTALGDALRVAAGGEPPMYAGVHDEERRVSACDRHRLRRERAAVDAERRVRLPERARHLVQHAARHADEAVLGAVGEHGEVARRERLSARLADRARHRHGERRGAREAGAARDVARDREVEAGRREPALREREERTRYVVDPVAAPHRRRGRELGGVRVPLGDDAHAAVAPTRRRDERRAVDRTREHEPFVVVGVLADQVDAPGCASDELGIAPVARAKGLAKRFEHCPSPEAAPASERGRC